MVLSRVYCRGSERKIVWKRKDAYDGITVRRGFTAWLELASGVQ